MDLLNKDALYDVLKEPNLENFRYLLQNHMGEEDQLDFKKEWEDNEKISKHLLAMANSGGGCIVFGVHQLDDGSFQIDGIEKLKDAAELKKGIKKYPYRVPKGCVFLLGDYRTQTKDSRDYGPIKMEDVKAKVITVLRRREL